jgi:hypothetical protein
MDTTITLDDDALTLTTSVTVLTPNGGSFLAGQALTVQWDTQGPVDGHAVLLSLDGGVSFEKLNAGDLPGFARNFTFVLPRPALGSAQAVVRVAARLNGVRVAVDDGAPFTLAVD